MAESVLHNRRSFLKSVAVVGAAGAGALAPSVLTAKERVLAAEAELRAALMAYDPTIRCVGGWAMNPTASGLAKDDASECRYLLSAMTFEL